MSRPIRSRRVVAAGATLLLALGTSTAVAAPAPARSVSAEGSDQLSRPAATAAEQGEPPVSPSIRGAMSADALPTAQINGVAYTQLIVGGVVFVGGRFSQARPAGTGLRSPAAVPRRNLLSYTLSTGELTSWAPVVSGQVTALAASPDGRTLYVGGQFTSVDGRNRYRLAAYDIATGTLLSQFAPPLDYTVNAIVTIGRVVYVGGLFNYVGGVSRSHLAAFRASDGALLAWNPGADSTVTSMVRAPGPDGTLVVGGAFEDLGTAGPQAPTPAYGLGALDLRTGAVRPWPANDTVRDYGKDSAITSLSTDGHQVYGSGYRFGSIGNLEGAFATDGQGRLTWVEDCHGDTYGVYSSGPVMFAVGHPHGCATVGGYPDTDPLTYRHALAFTTDVQGTLGVNTELGYTNWAGTPAPSLISWFPDFAVGNVTGLDQATWTVTGDGTYLAVGGEFPRVNGSQQQGLVRFAVRSVAPNRVGPDRQGAAFPIEAKAGGDGAVTVSFTANSDPDNLTLRYEIARDGEVIGRVSAPSTFWNRPTLTFVDSTAPAGGSGSYTVTAVDASGNRATSEPAQAGP